MTRACVLITVNATRRFAARPADVPLLSIGCVGPNPFAARRSRSTPFAAEEHHLVARDDLRLTGRVRSRRRRGAGRFARRMARLERATAGGCEANEQTRIVPDDDGHVEFRPRVAS